MLGCRCRGAAPDRVHAEQHRYVFRVDGRMPTMTCTAVAVQQTVDRTPGGAFNPPFRRRRPARDSADSGPGGRVEGDRRAAGGAGAGARGVLVIEGPPGIGKSRLLTEVMALADKSGVRTLFGEAFE